MKTGPNDLEERTSVFGENIIEFCLELKPGAVLDPLVRLLVRAATSVGANYCEADEAESKKDFRHKIAICHKETRETQYWLRMVAKACPGRKIQARKLWREVKELHLIFCAVIRTTDRNLRAETTVRKSLPPT